MSVGRSAAVAVTRTRPPARPARIDLVDDGMEPGSPQVLFVCVHNAGRSQMAAGWTSALSGGAVRVRSGGSEPGAEINPVAVAAMAEQGVDISGGVPRLLTDDAVRASDVVVTMGCGDACPVFPGTRYEDWDLPDPAGRSIEQIRPIRDEIRRRVERLLTGLSVPVVEVRPEG